MGAQTPETHTPDIQIPQTRTAATGVPDTAGAHDRPAGDSRASGSAARAPGTAGTGSAGVGTAWVDAARVDTASGGGAPGLSSPAEEPVAELLHRAGRGDQVAWARIVQRYTGLLWATTRCYDLSTSTAADVCQTTWLRLVERIDTLRHPERLGGWLATTARRESLRALRRELRERVGDPPERAAPDADPLRHALANEERRILWRALGGLPVRCRSILRMLAATPPPRYSEISAALEIPIGSIGPTRARCLRRLRTDLREHADRRDHAGEPAGHHDREYPDD